MTSRERYGRSAPRYRIRVPVEYENHATMGRGTIADVSTSGVRISTHNAGPPLSIGSDLRLRFSFFAGSFETPFGASVVRHTHDGFAVQFSRLDSTRHELLRQALPVPDNE